MSVFLVVSRKRISDVLGWLQAKFRTSFDPIPQIGVGIFADNSRHLPLVCAWRFSVQPSCWIEYSCCRHVLEVKGRKLIPWSMYREEFSENR
jgi:hypothetical protein